MSVCSRRTLFGEFELVQLPHVVQQLLQPPGLRRDYVRGLGAFGGGLDAAVGQGDRES